MPSDITGTFLTTLRGDATLQSQLSSYQGVAAVFATAVPEDAVLPYIVTIGNISHEGFDTKTSLGHDIVRDIGCYADDTGSPILIEDIAERVRTLFHRRNITVPGFGTVFVLASGPIINDGDRTYGRIVTVRLVLSGG